MILKAKAINIVFVFPNSIGQINTAIYLIAFYYDFVDFIDPAYGLRQLQRRSGAGKGKKIMTD